MRHEDVNVSSSNESLPIASENIMVVSSAVTPLSTSQLL